MKQLEIFCTLKIFTPLEQLARHMRRYPITGSYDEVLEWHKEANALTQQVRDEAEQKKYDEYGWEPHPDE
jgi:hypothetical protein